MKKLTASQIKARQKIRPLEEARRKADLVKRDCERMLAMQRGPFKGSPYRARALIEASLAGRHSEEAWQSFEEDAAMRWNQSNLGL